MFLDPDLSLKMCEDVLAVELDNWRRWGRAKNYLPQSFRCPIGMMYKPVLGDVHDGPVVRHHIDEELAEAFEKVVISLPDRQREAFVLHQLDRAHIEGHIRIVKGRTTKAQVMGVSVRRYHYLVKKAHQVLLMRWQAKDADGA